MKGNLGSTPQNILKTVLPQSSLDEGQGCWSRFYFWAGSHLLGLFAAAAAAAAAAKSLQLCPTLCDTIDGSPPGSAVPGILQARTLEWVAISFSHAGK